MPRMLWSTETVIHLMAALSEWNLRGEVVVASGVDFEAGEWAAGLEEAGILAAAVVVGDMAHPRVDQITESELQVSIHY